MALSPVNDLRLVTSHSLNILVTFLFIKKFVREQNNNFTKTSYLLQLKTTREQILLFRITYTTSLYSTRTLSDV